MAYENAYQITNPDCVLLPEEICYMNWQKYYMDYHQHPAGSIEFNYIVEEPAITILQGEIYNLKKRNLMIVNGNTPHKADFPGFLHQYEH